MGRDLQVQGACILRWKEHEVMWLSQSMCRKVGWGHVHGALDIRTTEFGLNVAHSEKLLSYEN